MMLLYLLNSWEGERNLSEFTGKTSRSVWGKFACLLWPVSSLYWSLLTGLALLSCLLLTQNTTRFTESNLLFAEKCHEQCSDLLS